MRLARLRHYPLAAWLDGPFSSLHPCRALPSPPSTSCITTNLPSHSRSGSVSISQTSLLSRRLNLVTDMTLEVSADEAARRLTLRRTAGHGFLEFEGIYTLVPRGGAVYLQYQVELVPCPIFPLPIVETKIRKEVPKMLAAVRSAAMRPPPARRDLSVQP